MEQLVWSQFTWEAVGAIAGAAAVAGAAATSLVTRVLPWMRNRLDSRSLRHRLGAADYHPSVLAAAVHNYVQPLCGDVDPAGREDYRSLFPISRPLFQVLDDVLHHARAPQYLLLLADSGMGKTSALINYYARNLRRWRGRLPVTLVYLGRKGVLERIRSVANKPDGVLFLDALDEDPEAIRDHHGRVRELMEAAEGFRAVVLSCRTQFFFKDEEITRDVGIAKLGPRPAGEAGEYRFQKLYLLPFSDRQVDRFLRTRYPLWRRGERQHARQVLARVGDLSARPMLLAYVDDLVQKGERLDSLVDAYERIVQAWLDREESHVGDVRSLRSFCEQLAVDIYLRREERGGEHVTVAEIATLAAKWNISLERWKLTGRSLLNRDAVGNFKFAHRSIMEYLFVRTCTGAREAISVEESGSPSLGALAMRIQWTDQMRRFAVDFLRRRERFATLTANIMALRRFERKAGSRLIAHLIRDYVDVHGFSVGPRGRDVSENDPALALLRLCHLYMMEGDFSGRSSLSALDTERSRPDAFVRLEYVARPDDTVVALEAAYLRPAHLVIVEQGPEGFVLSASVVASSLDGTSKPAVTAPLVLKGVETVWFEFVPTRPEHAVMLRARKRLANLMETLRLPVGQTHAVRYASWKEAVRDSEGYRRRRSRGVLDPTR